LNIGGQEFIGREKRINQMDLTSDCWMVQVWGIAYCSGFGDLEIWRFGDFGRFNLAGRSIF